MGRTNPTFRDRLPGLRDEWADYRRALRRRDREHFDRLFDHARAHADACGYLNHDSPIVAVLLSVALEQEAHIAELQDRLTALEENLAERDRAAIAAADDHQTAIEQYWRETPGERDGAESRRESQ
jgi:hypothetical protein